jgi:hypothetical protein
MLQYGIISLDAGATPNIIASLLSGIHGIFPCYQKLKPMSTAFTFLYIKRKSRRYNPISLVCRLLRQSKDMAFRWNDQAVIENHSLHSALTLIRDRPELNFCHGWGGKQRRDFRRLAISIVLATDMSRHFELLTHFTTTVTEAKKLAWLRGGRKWNAMADNQRVLTLQLAMKVSPHGTYLAQQGRPNMCLRMRASPPAIRN